MIENIPASIWTKQDLSEYQIFDVRTPAEWEEDGILDGAICVAMHDNRGILNTDFIKDLKPLLPKDDKKIAFICHSGHRSRFACELLLQELGIASVNLDGGMQALN
ncbi:rhodanese-like domain-containing protein [Campylobacter sp. US33a]|uniref:rhodanese-like domain-containing protein n=1 Tax=Campylobacter sp. US33a TaxID=2498120 RepID=UPI0010671DE2|nr:rhodanese-like domain-containing protein [Campylobacter sp. US33a]TEY02670.1 rhodanese-like domain-containing protein [Campylobacter sp. US33a]